MGLRGVFRSNQSSSIPKKIDTDFGTDLPSNILSSGISATSAPISVTAAKGRKWTFLSGAWGIVSNKLVSTSSSSSYPVVSTDAKVKDVSVELRDISNGAGVSLWVTDSGNWWGVGVYQDQASCNCSSCQDYACTGYGCTATGCTGYGCTATGCTGYGCTGYGCSSYGCTSTGCTSTGCTSTGCTSSGCLGTGCTGYGCKGYGATGTYFCGTADRPRFCTSYGCSGGYGCTGYGCTGGYGCKGYGCTGYGCTGTGCTGTGCTGYGCSSSGCTSSGCTETGCTSTGCTSTGCTSGYWYNYSCNCQTCYPAYIRLIKSVANSVTTVTTWAVSNVVKSIRVKTKGKDISVQSFSDANLSSAIQTDVYTASEANPTTKFGLIVNPSNYDEQKSMSKIKIERNK